MAFRQAKFEGQAPGTAIGVANSAAFGDDPFDAVTANGMSVTYGTTAMHGTGGAAIGPGAATQVGSLRYGNFSNAKASMRVYLRLSAYPTNEFQFCHTVNGGTAITGFNITPTGIIKVVGQPNASTVLYTGTATLSLNTWYRLEFFTTISATAGQVRFAVYTGDSTTPITGLNYDSGTGLNTGTLLIDKVEVGKITASAATGAFALDDYAVSDGVAALLGPFTSVTPTPKAGVTTGSAVIDCTASVAGQAGDTLTYTISPSGGTSQPARGLFVVPQQSSAVTYTVTVLESNGQSRTATAIVPAISQTTSTGTLPKVFRNGQWN